MKSVTKNKTIRERLWKFVLAAMTVAVVALMLVLGGVAIGFQVNLTNELQDSETNSVEQSVSVWYAERMAEVRSIRDAIENYDMTSKPDDYALADYLGYMLKENESKGIYDYYVGMEDTTCYFGGGWEPAPGEYDPTTRDWYKQSINSDDIYVSEAYVDAETGRVVITMSTAIKKDGKSVGVLAADIFTDDVQKIATSAFPEDSSKYVILVDRAGTVIAHKNKEFLPTADADGTEHLTSAANADIPEDVVNNSEVTRKTGSDYDGLFRVYTGLLLQDAAVSVIVVDTGIHYYRGVLIFGILCIVMFVIVVILSRRLTKRFLYPLLNPLNELMEMADDMSKGKLDYTAKYDVDDEIGVLCAAIEESNHSVRSYIDDIGLKLESLSNGNLTARVDDEYIGEFAQLKESINRISESLNATMNTILESSNSIRRQTGVVSEQAENLAVNVSGVDERMNDAIRGISEVKERFEENLEQTGESIRISDDAKSTVDQIYLRMEELTAAMDRISEKSNGIAEIIDMINSIAAQTNLLALNASIEAARAGESGKGFAVVADNVRELAAQTADAVSNSGALINETLGAVKEGGILVSSTVEEMKEIVSKTEEVNSHIAVIADSIRAESEIVEGVAATIGSIEGFVNETENTSKECVQLTTGLYEEVDHMHEIIGKFEL
ncbi:MAG: methyl-accepting chemotaxis protein [Eubacterium sp.]|nr:methyl-accepting chemotaxis protein [Eubacterium sp.]